MYLMQVPSGHKIQAVLRFLQDLPGGTVTYDGSSGQTVVAGTYNNLTINMQQVLHLAPRNSRWHPHFNKRYCNINSN